MTLYNTYSVSSTDEIVDAINWLHISFSNQETILSGIQACWYENNILGRGMAQKVLSSLLYSYDLQMKFVNI